MLKIGIIVLLQSKITVSNSQEFTQTIPQTFAITFAFRFFYYHYTTNHPNWFHSSMKIHRITIKDVTRELGISIPGIIVVFSGTGLFRLIFSPETKPFQSVSDLLSWHKEVPEQSAAVIFNHYNYGSLVDSKVSLGIPVLFNAETIIESIFTKYPISLLKIEILQSIHGFWRGIRKGW